MTSTENSGLAVGVDIGGTNMRAAVVDHVGSIVAFVRTASPIDDPSRGQQALLEVIRAVTAQAEIPVEELQGVGIGIPGWMDRVSGALTFAPKMAHWQGIFALGALQDELGVPVHVASDPNVATLGELWMGAGRGSRHLIMITLGTGLSCGIVIDGGLYVGRHGMAGEFGHIVIHQADDTVCDCGTIGCLETQAAGPAIARRGQHAAETCPQTLIRDLVSGRVQDVTTATVFAAAEQGDPVANRIVRQAGEMLGSGFATLVSLLEPEKIVVGGGMADVGELLLDPIRTTMAERSYLIARGYISVDIVPAELGDNAGVIGAAKLAFTPPVSSLPSKFSTDPFIYSASSPAR